MMMKKIEIAPCHGVPVVFDPRQRTISEARGIWRWKKIFVGPQFLGFDDREQQALLLHELGHCKLRHLEKRLLRLWLIVIPSRLRALCVEQEFEADLFAARCGFGPALAGVFMRLRAHDDSPLHPELQSRIERLLSAS